MKIFKFKVPLDVIIIIIAIIVNAAFYKFLPGTIRTHGNDESFGNVVPKWLYVVIIPLVMTLTSVLNKYKKENEVRAVICNIFLLAVDIFVMYGNLN